ncbi:MAG: nucleotide exchange factor GrpE [Candidatus Lokiarchaeota archaeon]|nr:nucleotide exchange factor GrpE [Candidatus Lokiarchaeota archaeon]MBD3338217.1 nucleotide exchange factor GrpE [Candidatus Lokiarchaeota archaeon]
MVFGDFDSMFGERRSRGRSDNKLVITEETYEQLKKKAEKLKSLEQKHEEVVSENEKLQEKLENLEDKLKSVEELEHEKEKYFNRYIQLKADFENFRKRADRDNVNYKKYALQTILKKLISHYDDLQRSLKVLDAVDIDESVKQGFKLIVENFKKLLMEENVKKMDCEGKIFDPYKHEVMMVDESKESIPDGTILEVFEDGYYYNDYVLRPAKVKIAK